MNTHTDVMRMGHLHERGYTNGGKRASPSGVSQDADVRQPRCG
jgi:hypothetical protein